MYDAVFICYAVFDIIEVIFVVFYLFGNAALDFFEVVRVNHAAERAFC